VPCLIIQAPSSCRCCAWRGVANTSVSMVLEPCLATRFSSHQPASGHHLRGPCLVLGTCINWTMNLVSMLCPDFHMICNTSEFRTGPTGRVARQTILTHLASSLLPRPLLGGMSGDNSEQSMRLHPGLPAAAPDPYPQLSNHV